MAARICLLAARLVSWIRAAACGSGEVQSRSCDWLKSAASWKFGHGEPDKMVDWQPIETAPKDGTRILLWDTDEAVIAKWGEISMGGAEGWQIAVVNMVGDVNYYEAAFNPTHWMPLPEPPRGYD
jgi:hypothetical protein